MCNFVGDGTEVFLGGFESVGAVTHAFGCTKEGAVLVLTFLHAVKELDHKEGEEVFPVGDYSLSLEVAVLGEVGCAVGLRHLEGLGFQLFHVFGETFLPLLLAELDIREHALVFGIGVVGDGVESPEGAGRGVSEEVTVSLAECFGHIFRATEERRQQDFGLG